MTQPKTCIHFIVNRTEGLPIPTDDAVNALFIASTNITVGDGHNSLVTWTDSQRELPSAFQA